MLINLRHLALTCIVAFLISFLNNSFNHVEFGIITEHSYLKVGKLGRPHRPGCFSLLLYRIGRLFKCCQGKDDEDGYQSQANRFSSHNDEHSDLDTFNNGVSNADFQEGDEASGGNTELPEQAENVPETPDDVPCTPVSMPRTKFNVLGKDGNSRPVPAPRITESDCNCGQKDTDHKEGNEFDDPDDKEAAFV
ncbi:hypothetical protein OJ253_2545 [Cryptosporidium canis]|uniref:Uncharacterized protein n=1 Tax=Cryptosporidium canis TaxID=195482 RepID=A0A9D5DLG3_9CRYT|nr:hypothetical protein OJ253_2545 [Cryptosporidium canis]